MDVEKYFRDFSTMSDLNGPGMVSFHFSEEWTRVISSPITKYDEFDISRSELISFEVEYWIVDEAVSRDGHRFY